LLVVIVLGVGGYAFYRWMGRTTNENASRQAPAGGTENTQQPDASTSPAQANTNSNSSAQTNPEGKPTSWETTASSLTGGVGTTFTLICTPGGTMHAVWGSDIYTADSSICTAAVHAGLITYEHGGTVTIELRPGRPLYGNSERNGVTTIAYGEYGRSFVFKSGTNDSAVTEADEVTPISWNTSASILSYEPGKTSKFKCPAGGKASTIWGTDVYTGDSSICTAAVHAGVITFDRGGTVTVELRPGQSSYRGTKQNGVTSNDYGAYVHSFVVR
jgi:LCCL domain-containing protein